MRKVTLIPGDGIGLEISKSVRDVFTAAGAQIDWEEVPAGLTAYETTGDVLPKVTLESIERTGVALKGPTTTPIGSGHRSVNVRLRQQYDLYANVRPLHALPGIKGLQPDVDMIIVRENTEDLYAGLEYKVTPEVAHGIKIITAPASLRIARYAFELAKRLNRHKVTAVHKANIMKLTDGLFLECVRKVATEYPDITYNEVIVDNACLQLVTNPKQFDVIVTENLFGDILSDLVSGLIGGLGVAAGANIGEGRAIFEAVHGSAPDIAGRDLANPTALLLSGLLMLDHIGQCEVAARLRSSLYKTIANPATRTRDLGGTLSCSAYTEALIANLPRQ